MEIKVTIPDIKKNDLNLNRMDMLEKRLDQQYKNRIEGKNIIKEIETLQSSFMKKLNRFMESNKDKIDSQNSKLADALKRVVNNRVKTITIDKTPKSEIKSFLSKIDSLEEAIRGITLKAKNNTSHRSSNNGRLNKSFEGFFARMEKLIKDVRPRMFPSPS